MKKRIIRFVILALFVMSTFFLTPDVQNVEAKQFGNTFVLENSSEINQLDTTNSEEPTESPEEPAIDVEEQIYEDLKKGGHELDNSSDIPDKNLYSALLQIVKAYIKSTYDGYVYTDSTLWNTMLKEIEVIDINNMDIESLSGLQKFQLPKLKTLTITNNEIATIEDDFFVNMPNLESLNLSSNQITTITFNNHANLKNINLSSNRLSEINFSKLSASNLEINLANNNFSSITNINFPTRVLDIKLNIINNNINDISEEYFDLQKLHLNVGLQGITNTQGISTFSTSQTLNYYKTNMAGVYIKIYKIESLADTLYKTITDNDVIGNSLEINLEVGQYYVEYYDVNGVLYESGNSEKSYFKTYKFNVIPSNCVIKYEFKGKIYDTFDNKVTGKVKVLLSCEDGGVIYYKVGNSDWQQGNEINCDSGGNYHIKTKVVIDGVESEEKSILIKTSLNLIIPDILMLILILLFTLALFFIVVPLVSKKWFKK